MSEPLSWQPKPVTKCFECLYSQFSGRLGARYCEYLGEDTEHDSHYVALHNENKDSITPSCPAWQEQQSQRPKEFL